MRRRILACSSAAIALAGLTTGCASQPERHVMYFRPAEPWAVTTLGSGDALGRQIYANDVMLAARLKAERRGTATVDVPVEIDGGRH